MFNTANLVKCIKNAHKIECLTVVNIDGYYLITDQSTIVKVPQSKKIAAAIMECLGLIEPGNSAGRLSGDKVIEKWREFENSADNPKAEFTLFAYRHFVKQKKKLKEVRVSILRAPEKLFTVKTDYLEILENPLESEYRIRTCNGPAGIAVVNETEVQMIIMPYLIDLPLEILDTSCEIRKENDTSCQPKQ